MTHIFVFHGMFWAYQARCRNDQSPPRLHKSPFLPSPLFHPQLVQDPIAGIKDGVTPQNNDSRRKEYAQVGGHLMKFRRALVEENCISSMLKMTTTGYILPFHLMPRLIRHPLIISGYKDLALASCIHSVAQTGHNTSPNTKHLWYYSF